MSFDAYGALGRSGLTVDGETAPVWPAATRDDADRH